MRRLYVFLISILMGTFLFSLDKKTYASSIDQWIDITENTITFNYCDPFKKKDITCYDYKLESKNELDWLIIKIEEKEKKILSLQNDEWLILYLDSSSLPFFIGYSSFKGLEFINYLTPQKVQASSELKEKSKIYYGYNITSLELDSPWVEAKNDYGIGEYLLIDANGRYIYLFNGYVSYGKPYLYDYNSRIKKLKISFIEDESKVPIIVEIEDTPNPQKIDLNDRIQGKLKIEILDIYPGTHYKDTCLNGIIFKIF